MLTENDLMRIQTLWGSHAGVKELLAEVERLSGQLADCRLALENARLDFNDIAVSPDAGRTGPIAIAARTNITKLLRKQSSPGHKGG